MSIKTTDESNVFEVTRRMYPPKFPRNDKGEAVSKECPKCGYGKLQWEGNGFWRCDGLMDPENPEKELEACDYTHEDGKPTEKPTP